MNRHMGQELYENASKPLGKAIDAQEPTAIFPPDIPQRKQVTDKDLYYQ